MHPAIPCTLVFVFAALAGGCHKSADTPPAAGGGEAGNQIAVQAQRPRSAEGRFVDLIREPAPFACSAAAPGSSGRAWPGLPTAWPWSPRCHRHPRPPIFSGFCCCFDSVATIVGTAHNLRCLRHL